MYQTLNPTTGELIQRYETVSENKVEKALTEAVEGFRIWRSRSFRERGAILQAVGAQLEAKAEKFARLIALEMGKPISEGKGEVLKCATACRFYAEHTEQYLQPEIQQRYSGGTATVFYQPLGPVLAIMPWNFPFWQVFRFAAPSLMAGNVVVLKHAPNTPGCALAIEGLFEEAGLPLGCFRSLFLTNEQAGRAIADDRIAGVTLTGSERAGRVVGRTAGENLKRAVLELGGSDPFVVLSDADIEKAAEVGVRSRCANAGQVCCAAKRFIVQQDVVDSFLEAFEQAARKVRIGDPLDSQTTMGPLARKDLKDALSRQVEQSKRAGAKVLFEVTPETDQGFFFGPAVLTDVPQDAPALQEELFGPVAVILPVKDEEEALTEANNTRYGLSASVWSKDEERAWSLARRIEAGSVVVNGLVTSDIAVPFGGMKASGFGRELAKEGTREFTEVRAIWDGS